MLASFAGLSLPYFAKLSGLKLCRAQRACRDLVKSGILTVHPIAKTSTTGEFSGLPAIRTLSEALFRSFNLGHWLKRERDKASKRRRNQTPKEEAMGRMQLAIKAAMAKVRQNSPQSQSLTPQTPPKHKGPLFLLAHLKGILKGTGPP